MFKSNYLVQLCVVSVKLGLARLMEGRNGFLLTNIGGNEQHNSPSQELKVIPDVKTTGRNKLLPYSYRCPRRDYAPQYFSGFTSTEQHIWDKERCNIQLIVTINKSKC